MIAMISTTVLKLGWNRIFEKLLKLATFHAMQDCIGWDVVLKIVWFIMPCKFNLSRQI